MTSVTRSGPERRRAVNQMARRHKEAPLRRHHRDRSSHWRSTGATISLVSQGLSKQNRSRVPPPAAGEGTMWTGTTRTRPPSSAQARPVARTARYDKKVEPIATSSPADGERSRSSERSSRTVPRRPDWTANGRESDRLISQPR